MCYKRVTNGVGGGRRGAWRGCFGGESFSPFLPCEGVDLGGFDAWFLWMASIIQRIVFGEFLDDESTNPFGDAATLSDGGLLDVFL